MAQRSVRLLASFAACACAVMLGVAAAVLAAQGEAAVPPDTTQITPTPTTTLITPPPPVTPPPLAAGGTAAPPGPVYPAPTGPAPTGPVSKVTLRLPRRGLRVSRTGSVTVPLTCPAASSSACAGSMVLEYGPPASRRAEAARRGRKLRSSRRGRRLRAARAAFEVAPGQTVKVRLRLSRRSRRLIRRRGGVRMQLEATTKRNGRRTTASRPVTVKISRRGRKLKR